MRLNRLASAAVAAVAISVPVTAVAGNRIRRRRPSPPAEAATKKAPVTWNMVAAAKAKKLVGDPVRLRGQHHGGFDCSGLAQWVYRHTGHGKVIDRIANDQFHEFKRVSHAAARPGDLVFFHDTSNLSSYVYHVGVYEGGNYMVAATTPGGGVQYQSFTWAGNTVSFGTITH